MKRIILIILIISTLMLALSGCGTKIVVNDKLRGTSDHWAVTYEVKGRIYPRVDRDGNVKFTSFGKYKATYDYIGDLSDIENLTQWSMKAVPLFHFASGRNCSPDAAPSSWSKGDISTEILLAFYNDEVPPITVTWNSDGENIEIINLQ